MYPFIFRPFRILVLVLTATGFGCSGFAQPFKMRNDVLDLITASGDSLDRNYIRNFEKLWTLRASYERKFLTFGFHPKGHPSIGPQFYPNSTSSIGISGTYRELGVGFGFSLPNSKTRIKNLGLTKSFDFVINSYKTRFGYDLLIYNYKGFFLDKPGLFYPESHVIKAYTQRRSDVKFFQIGGNYFNVRNSARFSFQAPYMFVKKQMRSAGSLLVMAGVRYSRIKGDSIIDTIYSEKVDERYAFGRAQYFAAFFVPGYSHTFVAGSWFVNATLFAGPGLQGAYYNKGNQGDKEGVLLNPMTFVNIRSAAGYNGDEFFFGGQVNFEFTRNLLNGTRYATRNDIFRVIAGVRL